MLYDREDLHLIPYTTEKERPFRIIKIGLTRDREELYDRINRRVEIMIEDGLEEEARKVYPYRALNSLNTVGYKEMFKYLDGEWTLPFCHRENPTELPHLFTQADDMVQER